MKKILIAVAVAISTAIGSNAVYAETQETPKTETTATAEDSFKAIPVDELPQAVKDSVARKYNDLTIKAAFVKGTEDAKTYKVTLADSEGNTADILLDGKGEIIPSE